MPEKTHPWHDFLTFLDKMNGILVIDKPSGMTSHDIVDFVRRRFGIRRVGHCGTLDPLATGVLVILLEKMTKLSSKFSSDDKEYIATMKLGIATDTQDAEGKIIKTASPDGITPEEIKEVILSFKGKQEQLPPMVSAKRHCGRRLYQLARRGITIKREPQRIDIEDIEILKISKPEVDFRIVSSKGTYIRTLCHDIGQRLGCGAHLTALRRIRSGRFHIKDAISLEELGKLDRKAISPDESNSRD